MAPRAPLVDPGVLTFKAEIVKGEKSACRFVFFPFSALDLFGRKGNIEDVKVTFNGVKSPGPLYRTKDRGHILLLRKALREKLGVGPGDTVSVTVQLARSSSRKLPTASVGKAATGDRSVTLPPTASTQPTDKVPSPRGSSTRLRRRVR